MEDLIAQYAREYESKEEKSIYNSHQYRDAYNPVVFLFIGDRVDESINRIKEEISRRWNNSSGIIYFHLFTGEGHEDIFGLRLKPADPEGKTFRKSLYDEFYSSEGILIELNQRVRQIKNRLFQYGSEYSCFEKINISVVTRVDDPINVLIPEITLLFKSKLAEDFKMVSTDLYALFTEREDDMNYGYTSAVSMAFFREIENFQSRDYSFNRPLEVLEEGIKFSVKNNGTPIFDLVYLFSDRNEDGVIQEDSMARNYKTIAFLTLLKNRNMDSGYDSVENESYNNEHFRQNILPGSGKNPYAAAGLSELKRPNGAIAITALYHYYSMYIERLKSNVDISRDEIYRLIMLDGLSLDSKVRECMPQDSIADQMGALMSTNVSYGLLQGMTYLEAEIKLYGDNSNRFFNDNYEKAAFNKVEEMPMEKDVADAIKKDVVEDPRYGLFCAYKWTSQEYIMDEAGRIYRDIQREIEKLEAQLKDMYGRRIIVPPVKMMVFGQKTALKNVRRDIIEKVYSLKSEILKLKIKLKIVGRIENALEKFHNDIEEKAAQLDNLKTIFRDNQKRMIAGADGYLGQNIDEYYKAVVKDITAKLADKWGGSFYFDDRFMGLNFDSASVISRVIDNCRKYILNDEKFNEPFENELLHRANTVSEYGNREVLSQEELFKNLYGILEKNARVSIYIINFAARHRYEEKYFFGDYNSTFIQYAFSVDDSSRSYKLGCINERVAGGIQKLNLMGGFTIDSVVYARKCFKYYEKYKDEGYMLHGMDEDMLPVIEFNLK